MRYIADLHLHGKYSRATSKNLLLPELEKYANIKGINLLSTADFTHPKWIEHLKENLEEDDTGILRTKTDFPFILQTELSLIYSQEGKGRRVHLLLYARNFEVVEQITEALLKIGRVDYDGRPIFGISCIEFTELMKAIDKDIEIVPAHIWTPWFSVFGSKGGFDSLKECFGDQLKHIHALETGLSSDPAMNWRLSQLDKYTLISNSDSHSFWPWRIGREANVFEYKDLTYDNFLETLKTRKNFKETIEVDPAYGKYHYDGHRKCNVCLRPSETMKLKGICPVCKKDLTIGVEYRVEELADRPEGYIPDDAIPFRTLMPLSDIISKMKSRAVSTKTVWDEYNKILSKFDNEMSVLLDATLNDLEKATDPHIAQAIIDVREGKIKVQPGYDGEYGIPIFSKTDKKEFFKIK